MEALTRDVVSKWSIDQVHDWAKQFGCRAAGLLKENEVDGAALLLLQYQDFYSLQFPAGPRRKILSAVAQLNGVVIPSSSFLPGDYKPFTLLKNMITEAEAQKIRNFFVLDETEAKSHLKGNDYSQVTLHKRLDLPALEARILELYPEMMIFNTHYFSGESSTGGVYSGWHTGVNLSKLFVGNPTTFSIWIPLQTLTEETGGRLWFYNGEYLDSVIDMLKITDKKTSAFQYLLLSILEKELEAHKITDDCQFGDAFYFWEWNPHCVDQLCKIKRDVISVRLVSKDAVIDTAFLEELQNIKEDEVHNHIETKDIMDRLTNFLAKEKKAYDEGPYAKK